MEPMNESNENVLEDEYLENDDIYEEQEDVTIDDEDIVDEEPEPEQELLPHQWRLINDIPQKIVWIGNEKVFIVSDVGVEDVVSKETCLEAEIVSGGRVWPTPPQEITVYQIWGSPHLSFDPHAVWVENQVKAVKYALVEE